MAASEMWVPRLPQHVSLIILCSLTWEATITSGKRCGRGSLQLASSPGALLCTQVHTRWCLGYLSVPESTVSASGSNWEL